jgi:hypothetical protein
LYVSDFPETNDIKVSFADDFSVGVCSLDLHGLDIDLNEDMLRISKLTKDKKLKISPGKLQVRFFTPDTKEHKHEPNICYEGVQIPVKNQLDILGLTFNTPHNFTPQEKKAGSNVRSRACIVKASMGTD